MAEALERSERVRHVYVHAGGKIEALGNAGRWANPRAADGSGTHSHIRNNKQFIYLTLHAFYFVRVEEGDESSTKASTVETVCVVDIRDNTPESTSFPYELDKVRMVLVYLGHAGMIASDA